LAYTIVEYKIESADKLFVNEKMEPIKCNICRKTKQSADFVKNGKTLKSCLDCRDKRKPLTTPEPKPVAKPEPKPVAKVVAKPEPKSVAKVVATPEPKPVAKVVATPEPKPLTKPEPKPETKVAATPEPKPETKVAATPEPKPESKPAKLDWVFLSNKWIKQGKELELHQANMKKLNLQYLKKCAFPVHQYLSRHWMVDIRDRYVG